MVTREKTLTEFIMEEQRRAPQATGDFTALLNHIRLACKRISFIVVLHLKNLSTSSSGLTDALRRVILG